MTAIGTLPQPRLVVRVEDGGLEARGSEGVVSGRLDSLQWWLAGEIRGLEAVADELGEPSSSTPERLLGAALRRWGAGALPRLRGEYLVAVWDGIRAEGFVSRDPLGAGGGYWSTGGGVPHVAGEIVDLLAALPSRPGPDRSAVAQWLSWTALADDRTLYAGVRRLLPGHLLRVGRTGWHVERYWRLRPEAPLPCAHDVLTQRLRDTVDVALREQVGERKAAVLLSGGLDSTGLAGAAHRLRAGSVSGYSGVFPGFPTVDEEPQIAAVAAHHDMPVTVARVRPRGLLAGTLPHLQRWSTPAVGWNDFWEGPLLMRAARDGHRAMLAGDGGDLIFGMRPELVADLLAAGRIGAAAKAVRRLPGMGAAPPVGWLLRGLAEYGLRPLVPPRGRAAVRRVRAPARHAARWLTPRLARAVAAGDDDRPWTREPGPMAWTSVAYLLERYLDAAGASEHLRRRTAAGSLRPCHPLLDLNVVRLALRIPPMALHDPAVPRALQRACIAPDVPPVIVERREKPRFDAFLIACLTPGDRAALDALLASPRSELGAFGDVQAARDLVRDGPNAHPRGPFTWFREVLRIAVTETWLRSQGDPALPSRLLAERIFEAPAVTLRAVAS